MQCMNTNKATEVKLPEYPSVEIIRPERCQRIIEPEGQPVSVILPRVRTETATFHYCSPECAIEALEALIG